MRLGTLCAAVMRNEAGCDCHPLVPRTAIEAHRFYLLLSARLDFVGNRDTTDDCDSDVSTGSLARFRFAVRAMAVTLGARLRSQREERKVSLAAISADTKIKQSLLDALERDDLSQWPQGIFRRAYVRAYARAIGLDADAILREFLDLYPDEVDVPAKSTVWPEPVDTSAEPPSSIRLRRLVTTARAVMPSFLQGDETGSRAVAEAPPLADAQRPTEATGAEAERPPAVRLSTVARLCTRLIQVVDRREVALVLGEVARVLDALGVIVWSWDRSTGLLRPAITHGYSEAVLARFPSVPRDADNAVAAAFRLAEPCIVDGVEGQTGAVAVPVRTRQGCLGVLAIEVRCGVEQQESVQALAVLIAAQLGPLLESPPLERAETA